MQTFPKGITNTSQHYGVKNRVTGALEQPVQRYNKKDVYKKSNNTACALLHTSSFIYFLILLLNDDVLAETRVWEMNKLDRLVKFTGLKVKKK